MNVRPPRSLALGTKANAVDVLEYEVLQEKASTLGRLTHKFEQALADLRRFETELGEAGMDAQASEPVSLRREALIDAAGEALWNFVVQRETCGFRNTEAVLREYRVPGSVRLRMGVAGRA